MMKSVTMSLVITFAAAINSADSAYIWHEYNGHWYTITSDHMNWEDAESEAVSLGGHLATVNDAGENAWLSTTFAGHYDSGDIGDTWASLVWIGLYQTTPDLHAYDPEAPNDWHWISGEEVNPGFAFPIWINRWRGSWPSDGDPGGSNHAYLHTDTHPNPGTWWNAPSHDFGETHPKGIIELNSAPVPEPASLVLWSGLGVMALVSMRRRRRSA